MTALLLLGSANGFAAASPSADAASNDSVVLEIGFRGYFKPGNWVPLRFRPDAQWLKRSDVSFCAEIPDPDGYPVRYPLDVDPATREVVGVVRFGRVGSPVRIVAVEESSGTILWTHVFRPSESSARQRFFPGVPNSKELIVVLAGDDVGVEQAVKAVSFAEDVEPAVVSLRSWDELPESPAAYEAVGTLVVAPGEDDSLLPDSQRDARRLASVEEWLENGGAMLFAAGGVNEAAFGDRSPLRPFLPGPFVRRYRLRRSAALEQFAGARRSLELDSSPLDAVVFRVDQGRVEAREADLPVVVHIPFGLGHVVTTAVDLSAEPLAVWEDRGLFVANLLSFPVEQVETDTHDQALMHYGYTDLSGQLRSALDLFPGVGTVPFFAVGAAVAVFLLLVGPLDWWLNARILKRRTTAWITLPLWIIGALAIAVLWANASKPSDGCINEVLLLDYDQSRGIVRETAWSDIFVAGTDRYDCRFTPFAWNAENTGPPDAVVDLAWHGLPGRGLGGMDTPTVDIQPWETFYRSQYSTGTIESVPIPKWSTKAFLAKWRHPAASPVEGNLRRRDALPFGTITNRSEVPLRDCLLAYGNWIYFLGNLGPGDSVQISASSERRELRTWLTDKRIVVEGDPNQAKIREVTTPYDGSSRDIPYIMRMMMFYDAAGGFGYTKLSHTYQPYVDCTPWLRSGRAVFTATPADDAGANDFGGLTVRSRSGRYNLDDRRQIVYLRCVLPVE
ncbi:hypothetical protein [Thermostilla marina]